MVEVDTGRCTGCGFCSEECPTGVFAMELQGEGRPKASVVRPEQCSFCGHCVAVCPAGAIVHGAMPQEGFRDAPDISIDAGKMTAFLLSRRSIRAFSERPVEREHMERLIEVATHAGTASNAQTEGFTVIEDKALLSELEWMAIEAMWKRLKPLGTAVGRKVATLKHGEAAVRQAVNYYERFKEVRESREAGGLIFRNAPAVVAVDGLRANMNVHANCAIAARNMEVLAPTLGLGTCWAGFFLVASFLTKTIARRLGLPDDRNVYAALMVGYPRHAYRKTIPRKPREVRWL